MGEACHHAVGRPRRLQHAPGAKDALDEFSILFEVILNRRRVFAGLHSHRADHVDGKKGHLAAEGVELLLGFGKHLQQLLTVHGLAGFRHSQRRFQFGVELGARLDAFLATPCLGRLAQQPAVRGGLRALGHRARENRDGDGEADQDPVGAIAAGNVGRHIPMQHRHRFAQDVLARLEQLGRDRRVLRVVEQHEQLWAQQDDDQGERRDAQQFPQSKQHVNQDRSWSFAMNHFDCPQAERASRSDNRRSAYNLQLIACDPLEWQITCPIRRMRGQQFGLLAVLAVRSDGGFSSAVPATDPSRADIAAAFRRIGSRSPSPATFKILAAINRSC